MEGKPQVEHPTSLSFSGSEKNLEAAVKQGDSGSPGLGEPETAVDRKSSALPDFLACSRLAALSPVSLEGVDCIE